MTRFASGSRRQSRNQRVQGLTYYDLSTKGGLTIVNPALTPATGQRISQTVDGVLMHWDAATTGQQVGLRYSPSTPFDWSTVAAFGFEIDFDIDIANASKAGLRIICATSSGGTYTAYWAKLINTGVPKFGSRILWINRDDFGVPAAGTPSWGSIAKIEILMQRSTNNTSVVPLDVMVKGFYVQHQMQSPVVTFSFDDGDLSQFTEGVNGATNPASCLAAYGWKASFYVNSQTIGTANKMTWDNLKALRDAGHKIYSHTHSHIANAWQFAVTVVGTTATLTNAAIAHGKNPGDEIYVFGLDPIELNGRFTVATAPDAFTLTYTCPAPETTSTPQLLGGKVIDHIAMAALEADYDLCVNTLVSRGFPDAGQHYAYPYGYHSPAVVNMLKRKGCATARSLSTMTGSTQGYGWNGAGKNARSLDWLRMPARSLGNTDTAATFLTDLALVERYCGLMTTLAHNLIAVPAVSRDFSLSEWALLLDAVKAKERAGTARVMLHHDYWAECIADSVALG